ncbi:MAG: M48 family metalloprotease [Thiobacillaceae bacterium]|nr:M48 family metalloprotease [Thiobacillaceae bacterium]
MMRRGLIAALLAAMTVTHAADLNRALRELLLGQPPAQPSAMGTPPQQPQQQPPAERRPGELLGGLLSFVAEPPYSAEEERNIGRTVAGGLLGAAPLVRDDQLQRYVNRVGRWVALQSERPDLDWRFGVIDSEDINAFAMPGGYVFITKGLYRRLGSEAELAGVLGHEIAHVVRKHHLRLLQQSRALADLGAAVGKRMQGGSPLAANFLGNFWEVFARGLDKEAEHEADRMGMVLAARAGYDAYGLPAVLQEIGHLSANDGRVAFLFKTHPHPQERLNQLAEALAGRPELPEGKEVRQRLHRVR